MTMIGEQMSVSTGGLLFADASAVLAILVEFFTSLRYPRRIPSASLHFLMSVRHFRTNGSKS
jgi:hypothetical protein